MWVMTLFSFIAHFIYCFINKNSSIHKAHLESIYLLVLTMMKNSRLILFFTFYIGCYLSYFRPFSSIVTSYLWKERKGWCFSFIFLRPRTVLLRSTVWYFLMALICFSVNFFVLYVYNKPWFGIQWETSYITDGNWLERYQWQIKWPIFHRFLELGIPGLVCYLIWMDALMVICDSLANDWRRGIYL